MWGSSRAVRLGCLTLALASVLTSANPVEAKDATNACRELFHTAPANDDLTVHGVIGEAGTFASTVRLRRANGRAVRVSHGGLDGPARIDESLISVTTSPSAKDARSITVAISDIVEPGTYKGRITLARATSRCTLHLVVSARERPQLAPLGGDAISLNLTRCWKACPGTEKVAVTVTDPGRALITATNVRLKLYRHKDGHKLEGVTGADIQLSGRDAGTVLFTVNKHELRPGHYDGVALLDVAGETSPVGVPASVDVKDGRTWPLIVIAIAFLARLLAGYLRRTSATQEVWRTLTATRASVISMSDEEKRSLIGHLTEARRRWEAGDVTGADTLLTAIAGWRSMLLEARGLLARAPGPPATPVIDAIAALRRAIADGDEDKVSAAMTDVRDAAYLAGYPAAPDDAILDPAAGNLAVDELSRPHWLQRRRDATIAYLERVVRVDDLAISLLANILEAVIVLALAFVVLNEAYFNNDTFGADWLKDYGTLFVTALGATAIGRLVVGVISRSTLLGDGAGQ